MSETQNSQKASQTSTQQRYNRLVQDLDYQIRSGHQTGANRTLRQMENLEAK